MWRDATPTTVMLAEGVLEDRQTQKPPPLCHPERSISAPGVQAHGSRLATKRVATPLTEPLPIPVKLYIEPCGVSTVPIDWTPPSRRRLTSRLAFGTDRLQVTSWDALTEIQ